MTNFLWYFLPILFGFVGHAMISNSFAYDDKDVVRKSFKLAIGSSCVWGILTISYLVAIGTGTD